VTEGKNSAKESIKKIAGKSIIFNFNKYPKYNQIFSTNKKPKSAVKEIDINKR